MKLLQTSFSVATFLVSAISASAADPSWWASRGVTTSAPESNLSPATIGQAKWMAFQALTELQDKLEVSEFQALKSEVEAIVPLPLPQNAGEFENQRKVLLVGQLKALAQPFYDHLRAVDSAWLDTAMAAAGTRIPVAGSDPEVYHPYPWTTVSSPANHSPANLGQLKAVFALSFPDWTPVNADTDGDGLDDNWEWLYFSSLDQNGDPDPDSDGYTNAQEFAMGTNPFVAERDVNSNGLPDAWETANAGKFAAFPPLLGASLERNQTAAAPVFLRNDTAAAIDYTISLNNDSGPSYSFEDSITGGVSYQWEDISTSGEHLVSLSNSDDSFESVALTGFSFPFYGKTYSEVFVGSNGLLTFNSGSAANLNTTIPGESSPPDLIAPFWDDLDPGKAGNIYIQNEAGRLIVQFEGVERFGSGSGSCTFQVVLHSSGNIEFRYKTITATSSSCSVGIQDSVKVLGIGIPTGASFPASGSAISFSPVSEFFNVTSLSGTVAAHSTVTLAGTFRSLTLPGGNYQAGVSIDPVGTGSPPITLAAKLLVTDYPTTVTLTAPQAGGSIVFGNFLDLTADASDLDGVAKVQFFDGNTLLGDDFSAPYSLQAYGLTTGKHTLTATALDTFGSATTSGPLVFTVHADTDSDGMPDIWELLNGFDPENHDSGEDPDRDGYTNLEEFLNGTDPHAPDNTADLDNDGMWDRWESLNGLNPSINDSALNPDGDLRADNTPFTNVMEFLAGTHPQIPDTDSDDMPDGWEVSYSLAPRYDDSEQDADSDGFTNLEEYQNQTNPRVPESLTDADNDGMLDAWEIRYGLNPAIDDSALDLDGDGLTNLQEFNLGTKPHAADTDKDDLPDGWEVANQLDPLDPAGLNGGYGDPDHDEVPNLEEFLHGSNPNLADTDGDGTSDRIEIDQGSDPNDASDGGLKPIDPVEDVPFKVYGDYASWRMEIQGQGPRDYRKLLVITPGINAAETKSHKLRKNNKYKVTLHHTGSRADQPETWFCWEALVGGNPTDQTFYSYSPDRRAGVAEFFAVGGGWIVDNRSGLFTKHNHRRTGNNGGGNVAVGLESFLLPVEIEQQNYSSSQGIRFCRWVDSFTGNTLDSDCADKDRDHFRIRIPAVLPNLTKIHIKSLGLATAVIDGQWVSKSSDGDYDVTVTEENGAMVSTWMLLVADGDDDKYYNGIGTDNGPNDQTLLANFNSPIEVTLPEYQNTKVTFHAQKPLGDLEIQPYYLSPAGDVPPPWRTSSPTTSKR